MDSAALRRSARRLPAVPACVRKWASVRPARFSSLYAPDTATIAVQLRRADGTLDPQFGAAGTSIRPAPDGGIVGRAFVQRLPDGDVVVIANGTETSIRLPYSTLVVLRLDSDGRPDSIWGRDGIVGFVGFEWGPLSTDGGGLADVAGDVRLYGSSDNAFFRQSLTRLGTYYPYFPSRDQRRLGGRDRDRVQ
jgi:hypothetical protein